MATITEYSQFDFASTTAVVAITAPPTDGAILVSFFVPTGTTVSSVTDSTSGTYVLDWSRTRYNADGTLYVYRRSNIDNAPTSVTVTFSGAINVYTGVLVVDGMSAGSISPTITDDTTNELSYLTSHTASFTTGAANEIGFVIWSQSGGDTSAAVTSGWSVLSGADRSDDAGYNGDLGAAGAKTVEFSSAGATFRRVSVLTYAPAGGGAPTVSTVSSNNATEGSPIVHTVTLSGATSGTTNFAATLVGVTATGSGTDFTSALGSATYSNGVTFSAGNMVVPNAISSWTVSVPTTSDTTDEVNETYTLTVGGVSGTGTINDDDAEPSITVANATQVGSTVTFTLTMTPASGKSVTVDFATSNGRKLAGTHYTALTGTATFAAGETTKAAVVTVL